MPITGSTRALEYSRLGVMRLGASRLDYYQPFWKVFVNGVDQTANMRVDNATVTRTFGSTPSTFTSRVAGFVPVVGQDFKLYLGDTSVSHLLFAGNILQVTTTYEGTPNNVAYDISCIDYTWRLNTQKVLLQFTNTSATDIIKLMVGTYANTFTTVHVASNLPVIDAISFTQQDLTAAFDQVMQRIGGYWYADFGKDIHAFVTDADVTTAVTDTSGTIEGGFTSEADLSQTRTLVWSQGGGSTATVDVNPGSNTIPVGDAAWYADFPGGYVTSGAQRIIYSGKSANDGLGTVTSGQAGASPSPVHATFAGVSGNLGVGQFQYKTTFVSTAGESAPSPAASVTIPQVSRPTTSPTAGTGAPAGGLTPNKNYWYAVTFVDAVGETDYPGILGPANGWDTSANSYHLTNVPVSPDARVTKRRIYRTAGIIGFPSGSGTGTAGDFKLVGTINDNTTTTFDDTTADGSLGATCPTLNTTGSGQVNLTSVVTGPAGTTSRKIYRTAVGGSTFKLQSTIADNVTTTATDNTADSSLGATLTGSSIGASIGDASIPIDDATAFNPGGGWALVGGSQYIRYGARSGIGEGFLLEIPASGPGSITSFIPAGTFVLCAPHLTGCFGIIYPILQGDQVNVMTLSLDANAESVLASALGGSGEIDDFISDGRMSLTETQARGDAQLAELKDPITTLTFGTRDQTFEPGRTVTMNLSSLSVSGSYKVQQVTITDIATGGTATLNFPLRNVTASSVRFSFENLLRQLTANTR
jgi:hypothetical protein